MKGIYGNLSFVLASSYRTDILKALSKSLGTPSTISKEINKSISHVSRTLRELSERNLVECVTPERRKGKIYKITDEGLKVAAKVLEITS